MIITTSTEKEEEEKEVGNYTIVPLHRSRPQKYLCRSSDVNYQQRKKGKKDQKCSENALR
jgi:hypothetical protein